MKKRTLLLGLNLVKLPPGAPQIPGPGASEAEYDAWHAAFEAWNDAGRPSGEPCGEGNWTVTYYDADGNQHTINQDSSNDEIQHFQDNILNASNGGGWYGPGWGVY